MPRISTENRLVDIPSLNRFRLGNRIIVQSDTEVDRVEGEIIGIELQKVFGSERLEPSIALLHEGSLIDGLKPDDCALLGMPQQAPLTAEQIDDMIDDASTGSLKPDVRYRIACRLLDAITNLFQTKSDEPVGYLKPSFPDVVEPLYIKASERVHDWQKQVFTIPVFANPQQEIAKLKEKLEWYDEQAEALAHHSGVTNPTGLDAAVGLLALEGGHRAKKAIVGGSGNE